MDRRDVESGCRVFTRFRGLPKLTYAARMALRSGAYAEHNRLEI